MESGLNEAVWAPWFSLPTCESYLRSVDPGTYMGDADLGEMFLNFPLDKHMRKYAGVDFQNYFQMKVYLGNPFRRDGRGCSWGSGPRRTALLKTCIE